MYEVFRQLCELRRVSPSSVAKDCGISPSTMTRWKKDEYVPKVDKLQKIADYFGVSLHFLMTGEGEAEVVVPSDQVAREVIERIHNNPWLIEMIYDFADIDEQRYQRLKGYYDAISREPKRG